MKILKLFIITLLFVCCKSPAQNQKPIKVYEQNLSIIENAITSNKIEIKKLNDAIDKIEKVSNIKSYEDFSDYGSFRMPVSYNLRDWKLWLKQNKTFISFQENTNNLIATNAKPLIKNPSKLFNSYLSDLKKMESEENYIVHEINYILNNLERITNFNFVFNEYCSCRFPTSTDFNKIDIWFKENEKNLRWNIEKQQIELSK